MIQLPDLFNGLFEALGSVAIFMHVGAIWRDKKVNGFSPWAVAFFTAWGYWNLFYYPHLDQWFSFAGGLGIVLGNTTWVALILKYRKNK